MPSHVITLARPEDAINVVSETSGGGEDGVRAGGVGASVSQLLRDHELDVSVRNFGIPTVFLEQGKRAQILTEIGLTAQDISLRIVETMAQRTDQGADERASGSINN